MDVKSTLMAVLCGAAALAAQAGEVYKWVDPAGRIHFSDLPQPGWQRVDLRTSGSSAPGSASVATSAADEAEPANGDAAASVAAREKLRAEECARAKDKLESYRRAAKIVERDGLGNEKEYSTEERLKLLELTQKNVTELCGAEAP